MSCNIEYSENKDLKILTRTFSGDVHMEDSIDSWNYLINNKIITPSHIGVVSDLRKVDIIVDSDKGDLNKIAELFKENINIFKNLRLATIINTPGIVFPILFQDEFPEFQTRPFSTIEAAIDWICQ